MKKLSVNNQQEVDGISLLAENTPPPIPYEAHHLSNNFHFVIHSHLSLFFAYTSHFSLFGQLK